MHALDRSPSATAFYRVFTHSPANARSLGSLFGGLCDTEFENAVSIRPTTLRLQMTWIDQASTSDPTANQRRKSGASVKSQSGNTETKHRVGIDGKALKRNSME
jgi:hypothetical protein